MRKILLIFITLVALGGVAFAEEGKFPQPKGAIINSNTLPGGPQSIIDFMDTIANWLFVLLLSLAVIFILLAAYNYLTGSTGEGVGKAHKMILWAAVAIAVAVLSKGIVFAIRKLVDRDTPLRQSIMHYENHHA